MSDRRLLVIANERENARQASVRRTLAALRDANLIDDFRVFSPALREDDEENPGRDLLSVSSAAHWKPSVTLALHPAGWKLRNSELQMLADRVRGRWIYYEGDPYGAIQHTLPRPSRLIARRADVAFTVGTGTFRRNLERAGSKDVRWAPSAFDSDQIPPLNTDVEREFDFVMIANRNEPRLPFRALPGARARVAFVEGMQATFGERFAIWGHGWEGPSARGPLAFGDQGTAIQSAWFSVNWDHFPKEPSYFSNRLPISMASGSFHLSSHHPGYDSIFRAARGIAFADSPRKLVELAEQSISTWPEAKLKEEIRAGRQWAFETLRSEYQVVRFLRAGGIDVSDDELRESLDHV